MKPITWLVCMIMLFLFPLLAAGQGWLNDKALLEKLQLSDEQNQQLQQMRYESEKQRIEAEAKLQLAELEMRHRMQDEKTTDEQLVKDLEMRIRAQFALEKIELLGRRKAMRLVKPSPA